MAQILRYRSQPAQIAANHTYTDYRGSCTGSHSVSDAGMQAYQWGNMPNSIDSGNPLVQRQAIGQLMYHCAVALESNFEWNGTGADPFRVPSVFREFFNYACCDFVWRWSYDATGWYAPILNDIEANRPVFYAMWEINQSGQWTNGHAVVCDGYQNGNEIHLNLGWSGSGNAWYNQDRVITNGYTWTVHGAAFGIAPGALTLTLQSSGADGVGIYCTANVCQKAYGATPFTLKYPQGAFMLLETPLEVGGWRFARWTGDVDYQNGSSAAIYNMDRNRTVTAVYESYQAQPGTDLAIDSTVWDDSVGNRNGVIEGGEDVSVRIRLRSSANVSNLRGVLSSSVGSLQFKGNTTQFSDDIPAGGTGLSGFMYMVLNQESYENLPLYFLVNYQKGGASYYQNLALTKTFYRLGERTPSFVFDHVVIDDSQGGNGNGIWESGEDVDLQLYLRNNGNADATVVTAYLSNAQPASVDVGNQFILPYPDLLVGGSVQPALNGRIFFAHGVPPNFYGAFIADIVVVYTDLEVKQVLRNQLITNVQPARWISVDPRQRDFGVSGTDRNVTNDVTIYNAGSAALHVTAVTTNQSDTSWSGPPLPWTIPVGGSNVIRVAIRTAGLQGQISRTVVFESDGRPVDPSPPSDRVTITGLITDASPVFEVPGFTTRSYDAGGFIIVWEETSDIYAYNLQTGQELGVCTNPAAQYKPRISGNLIAWEDGRNGNSDIYAYNLATGQEFPVTTNAANEVLVGVDGNRIAYTRVYYTFTEPANVLTVQNLYVYDFITGTTTNITNFQRQGAHDPLGCVDDVYFDFGGGLLVWSKTTYVWNSSNSRWDGSGSGYRKMRPGVESSSSPIATATASRISANDNKVVWVDRVSGYKQVFLWTNGVTTQITTEATDHACYGVAVGNKLIVYDKCDLPSGLFYRDLGSGQEGMVSPQFDPPSISSRVRMDGGLVVWADRTTRKIYYTFPGQADVSVVAADVGVSTSQPLEGQPFNVMVTAHNLSAIAASGDVTVRLYDGNPDSGSPALRTNSIAGGISSRGQASSLFSNVTITNDGTHTLYIRVFPTGSDNPGNNTASISLVIQDTDTTGPIIADVSVTEYNGDGDGKPGSDEQTKISWLLSDPSGIGSTQLFVDGAPASVQGSNGNYFAILNPLTAGGHQLRIVATDADTSPATNESSRSFTVYRAECLTLLYGNQPITNGSTINLGMFVRTATNDGKLFVLRNDGEQRLVLGAVTVDGGHSIVGPPSNNVEPGQSTYFLLNPNKSRLGSFTNTVSLPNSDPLRSNLWFRITGSVISEPPRFISIHLEGSFVELTFSGEIDTTYRIESTPTLQSPIPWITNQTVVCGTSPMEVPLRTNSTTRFYRLVHVP